MNRRGAARGTGYLLYINQHIFKDRKKRQKNLAMMWIDFKKAFDMIPQSWKIDWLKMYKIFEVIKFIEKTMKNKTMELVAGGKSLTLVKFQRGVFQGDVLSPFLFLIAMMPLNYKLWKCIDECNLTKSKEKINRLMYQLDIKLFD